MEQRVKERLTGAIILVGVTVLLVPEMFRGDQREPTAAATPANPAGPPLQSYTIDLGAVPAAVRPAATASATAMPPAAAPPAAASPAAASPAAAPLAAAPPAAVPPTAPPAVAAPDPTPEAAAPAHTAPPPASNTRSSATASAGDWVVQVGSFSKRENAARMVQQAAKQGVRLAIAAPDERGLYRVRTALQPDRETVIELQQQLAAKGFKGMIARVH